MINFRDVVIETECALCGNKEEYSCNLETEMDMGEMRIDLVGSHRCLICNYKLEEPDNQNYCDVQLWENDKSVNENYDTYITPEECSECSYFKDCTSSHQYNYPKAFCGKISMEDKTVDVKIVENLYSRLERMKKE